jgi:stage V sporulation protein AE
MNYTVLILSFVVGGLICALAQVLLDLTRLSPARILVFLVCFGVFLGAIGLYKPIFEAVGCGISVPLIGFGGTVAEGVKESVDSFGLFGVLKGPFTSAAPGCSAALISGYLFSLIFKGRPKRA